jgi:hypothetical protein
MKRLLARVKEWLTKEPIAEDEKTQEISQAIEELRGLNHQTKNVLDRVKQPDILRSLVISMNAGKNQ